MLHTLMTEDRKLMRWTISALVIRACIVFASSRCCAVVAQDDQVAVVEDVVEKLAPKPALDPAPGECCITGSAGFINRHFLLVSTMDGKMTAMDVNKDGKLVWTVDADKMPLLSSSLSSQKLMFGNVPYLLVPSLDGSLYMFSVKSNTLNPIPLNTNVHIMIGDQEIAGGKFVTSTGIDPISGKIRYQCTSGKCTQYKVPANDSSSYTLIMRKNTQIARAADPFTGAEKWNISVGEYDVSLVSSDQSSRFERSNAPTHVHFLLEPPIGAISAVDDCGNFKWGRRLSSPIARAWQLFQGKIFEVSLFSSETVSALSEYSGNGREFAHNSETPFYFGTVNSEPYIIPSDLLREELRRIAIVKQSHFLPQAASVSHQLIGPFLNDLKVGDLIKQSYGTIASAELPEDPSNSVALKSLTCSMYDAVTIVGSRELKAVKRSDKAKGDRGWYIFQPFRKACLRNNPFQGTYQKEESVHKYCKQKTVFEGLKQIAYEPVSGWWKIVALILTLVAILLAIVIVLYSRRIRRRIYLILWYDLMEQPRTHLNSSPPKTPPSAVEFHADSQKILGATGPEAQFAQEPFSSKFLEDFVPEKCLGRGGYGVVFNCRNRLDDRSYAVKRIAVSNKSSAIDRVKREARAMARLDHPGIIRYFHTWMEKPPPGWQQARDQEILQNIRSVSGSMSEFINSSENQMQMFDKKTSATKDSSLDVELSFGPNITTYIQKDNGNNDIEWADGNEESEKYEEVSADSDSFSSEDSVSSKPGITAVVAGSDNSSSVVFAHDDTSVQTDEEIEVKNDAALDPLEPPVVLVTSMADLKNCKRTKDYVYLYIQMELCQELTLHNWLLTHNSNEDRELNQMRTWLAELVCAIDYIHSQGLIHRDLKPQNIFFSADNYLKIGDLGLATNYVRAEETTDNMQDAKKNVHHTGNVGTRLYMSPEQLKGKPYNEKIDVFSLGLIFVELIVPFATVMERSNVLSGIQNGVLPNCLEGRLTEKEFVAWLTATDPKRRPSARQLAECEYLCGEVNMLGSLYFRKRVPSGNP